MKNLLSNSRHILAAVFLLGGVDVAAAAVVVTFSGQVTDVGAFGASPPAGVSVGNTVSGTVKYSTAGATVIEVGPSERAYIFQPGFGNEITITIGTNVWKTDLQSVSLCDDAFGGDYLDYLGTSLVTATFPGNLGSGLLGLDYSDSETPYDLLNGHDLTNAPEDIGFAAAQVKAGSVSSSDGVNIWAIQFDVDSQTVPVQSLTWGEIKALYARP